MDSMKNYFISIIAATIICSIVTGLVGNKSTVGSITKLLTGLFLIITVISPLTKLNINSVTKFFSDFSTDASEIVTQSEDAVQSEMTAIIKSQTEAYILDKASIMGLDIDIQVTMSESLPSVPETVVIKGSIAPYSKQQLEQILCNDLGIAKENQHWI